MAPIKGLKINRFSLCIQRPGEKCGLGVSRAPAAWRPGVHPPPHQPSPSGSASATPPQGGSDTGTPYASLKITPPLRGSRREGGARSRAGGGQTPRPVDDCQPGRHRLGARASRPHPVPLVAAELECDAAGSHRVGGNRIGQAEGEAWRRSRLIQVGEMAEAVPGFVRASRPRSREAFIP